MWMQSTLMTVNGNVGQDLGAVVDHHRGGESESNEPGAWVVVRNLQLRLLAAVASA